MSQKRAVTLILGIIFLALAVYSILAWINNLSVAWQWHYDVVQKTEKVVEAKEADKDSKIDKKVKEAKKEKVFKGPMSSLDWTCVDMTTVSTLVPFMGFLLIGIGFFRILIFKKEGTIVSKNFPFFEDYDRIMVILGLAGTLWGIIMIGYYPTEEVNMPKLMLCLHTSLYSTLVVVLWIFIIARPMANIMQWWYVNITGREIRGDADISALFRELGAAVSGATQDFQGAGREAKAFYEQASSARDVFGAIKSLSDNLTASCQNINNIAQTLQAGLQTSQKTIEKQQKFLDQLNEKLSAEMRLRQEAEQRAVLAEKEKEKAVSWLEQVKALLKGLR